MDEEEVEERFQSGFPARNLAERLYYRRRTKGTGLLSDMLVAAGSGPGAFVTSMGSGLAGVARAALPNADPETGEGLDLEPEFLTRMQESLQTRSREVSEAGFEANAPTAFVSRLAAETAGVLGTVGAITSTGRVGRVGQALRLRKPLEAAGRVGQRLGLSRGAALTPTLETTGLGTLLSGTPTAAIQAAGGEEGSSVLALSQLLPEDSEMRGDVERWMSNPALRVASEVALDTTLGGVMDFAITRIGRARAGRRARADAPDLDGGVREAEFEATPPATAEEIADGITRGELGGEVPRAPRAEVPEADEAVENLVRGGMDRAEAEATVRRGEGLPNDPLPTEVAEEGLEGVRARQTRAEDVPIDSPTGQTSQVRGMRTNRERQIQFDKFGVEPEAARAAEARYNELRAGGAIPDAVTKSHESVIKAAQEMGVDDLAKAKLNKNLDSVMLTSLRVNFEESRQQVMVASRRIAEIEEALERVPTPDQPALTPQQAGRLYDEGEALERGIQVREKAMDSYMSMFIRGASEAGRTLNSLKAMARGSSDPFYWMLKARKLKAVASGQQIGGGGNISILRDRSKLPRLTQHEQDAFNTAINAMKGGDDRAMADFMQMLVGGAKPKTMLGRITKGGLEFAVQYRRASLLTGIKTMGRNIYSGVGESFLEEVPDRAVASVVDRLLAPRISGIREVPKIRNAEGELVGPTGEAMRATIWNPASRSKAAAVGAGRGGKKGLRVLFGGDDFTRGIESGVEGDLIARKWEENLSGRFDKTTPVGKAMSWVFDLQGAYDSVFRFSAFWGAIDEMATLQVRHLPENARAAAKRALVDNPHAEMIDEAVRQSAERVFANQTALSRGASVVDRYLQQMMRSDRATDRLAGQLGRAAFGIIAPFRRTPSSLIVRFAGERMPVTGWINTALKGIDLRKAGNNITELLAKNGELTQRQYFELQRIQKEFDTAFGRTASGTALTILLGAYLARHDMFAGAYPTDTGERQKWRQQGKTPWSLKIGGEWHSLAGVAPLGNLLGWGSQLFQDAETEGMPTAAAMATQGAAKMVLEQSMMRGFSDLNRAVNEAGGWAEGYSASFAGSFVPTILSDIAILTDGKLRESRGEGIGQSMAYGMMRRIPGLSDNVPAQQDYLGREIPLGTSAAINPLVPRTIPTDPVGSYLVEENLRLPETRRRDGETVDEERLRNKNQGAALQNAVSDLFRIQRFRRMDHDRQQMALAALVSRVRTYMNENDQQSKNSWGSDIRRVLEAARR